METFNKNWLAILIIAFVFYSLGYLTASIKSNRGGEKQIVTEKVIKSDGKEMTINADGDEVTVKIDTLKNDGKNIEIKVEKKLKK